MHDVNLDLLPDFLTINVSMDADLLGCISTGIGANVHIRNEFIFELSIVFATRPVLSSLSYSLINGIQIPLSKWNRS
jgi:hypothetical protein